MLHSRNHIPNKNNHYKLNSFRSCLYKQCNLLGEHKSFILVEDLSDHPPVMVCFNLSLSKSEKLTVTLIRDTKNFDIEKFLDKLTEGMELLNDIK